MGRELGAGWESVRRVHVCQYWASVPCFRDFLKERRHPERVYIRPPCDASLPASHLVQFPSFLLARTLEKSKRRKDRKKTKTRRKEKKNRKEKKRKETIKPPFSPPLC